MRTFSYNSISEDYSLRVLQCMEKNKGYICYFNGKRTPEAYQQIYMTAMKAENRRYTDLTPYIKVLARNILKQKKREIPYSPFDEEGEVAFIFTPLTNTDDYCRDEDIERIDAILQELYLRNPEDFMMFKQLIPNTTPKDITPIKNKEMAQVIQVLRREFDPGLVLNRIVTMLTDICKEKANVINAEGDRQIAFKQVDFTYADNLTTKKWLKDKAGNAIGINRDTLYMDNDFNPELSLFRLITPTSCTIWRLDMSDILSDIEEKIYVEQGVDTEYIRWCKGKYLLVTPTGRRLSGMSRDAYMEVVRREIILAVLYSGIGTIIALSPDNIYLKLTKATALVSLQLKTEAGKLYTLPMSVQDIAKTKA